MDEQRVDAVVPDGPAPVKPSVRVGLQPLIAVRVTRRDKMVHLLQKRRFLSLHARNYLD